MPWNTPLRLTLDDAEQVDDLRNDGTRLGLTVSFLETLHHLTLVRVTLTPVDGEGAAVTDGGVPDHREWRADHPDDQEELENLGRLYSAGSFETVEVPGYPGRYVSYMVPFDT